VARRGDALRVVIDPASLAAVRGAVRDFGEVLTKRAVREALAKAGRVGAQRIKNNLLVSGNVRTRQLVRAEGEKVVAYKDSVFYALLVGPRSHQTIDDPRFGRVTPTKYMHLVEGGRRAVAAKRAGALAIKLAKLDPSRVGRRKAGKGFRRLVGGWQWKLLPPPRKGRGRKSLVARRVRPTKRQRRASQVLDMGRERTLQFKKVGGGYVVFARRADKAFPYKPVARAVPDFAAAVKNVVAAEVWNRALRAAAKAELRKTARLLGV
jgi:hypothetical protein